MVQNIDIIDIDIGKNIYIIDLIDIIDIGIKYRYNRYKYIGISIYVIHIIDIIYIVIKYGHKRYNRYRYKI